MNQHIISWKQARQNKRIDTLNAVLDAQQHALANYHVGKNAAVDGDRCVISILRYRLYTDVSVRI